MEELVLLNLIYFLFAFFLIYPPNEVVSAGLSIPAIFSSALGSEQMHFIHYHMVRVLITIVIHAMIPIGYYLYLGFFSTDLNLFNFSSLGLFWKLYVGVSILFAIFWLTLVYYWKMNNFSNHPIASCLRLFARNQNRNSWKEIANEINIEFRRVDKFSAGTIFNRLYVTDNWLIKVGTYTLNISSHQNIELILTKANEVNLTHDGTPVVQYLTIFVKNLDPRLKSFNISLNSLEYKEFKEKLQSPINEASDIILKQSLPEQFLDAFRAQIQNNRVHNSKREVNQRFYFIKKLFGKIDFKIFQGC